VTQEAKEEQEGNPSNIKGEGSLTGFRTEETDSISASPRRLKSDRVD